MAAHETDVVVVGGGPVGLFQVFELGLLGLKAEVVDSLPVVGGQCMWLYPDKPIYDIPAVPVCTGRELIEQLEEQIKPFGAGYHLDQRVERLVRKEDGRFEVETSKGTVFDAGAVVIAAGVGSFTPRRLKIEGAKELEGKGLSYAVKDSSGYEDKDVVILGGGDSALDWTHELADRGARVVLVHRRDDFRAAPASVERMRERCEKLEMQQLTGTVKSLQTKDGRVTGITVASKGGGALRALECDEVLCFYGLSPSLGPIAEWGLDIAKRQLKVDTEKFQTNEPGIFAVGDVNTYPGKKKLILSGFHETALAAFAIKAHLNPGEKVHLQYTTTSPTMHKRLGVENPYDDEMKAAS